MREIVPTAPEVFRDQYVMEFIGGKTYATENSLKNALIEQMKDFILELGSDFIYINKEYRLQVGNSDFRVDLLFYHRELQCLVAFELKMGKFEPAHLGQLNFYLEALDRDVKKPHENPSVCSYAKTRMTRWWNTHSVVLYLQLWSRSINFVCPIWKTTKQNA